MWDANCNDLEQDICDFSGGEQCCLQSCLAETQQMTACIHTTKSLTDLTLCKPLDTVGCSAISLSGSRRQAPDGHHEAFDHDAGISGASSRGLAFFGLLTVAAALLA